MSPLSVFSLAFLAFSVSALEQMTFVDLMVLIRRFRPLCLETSGMHPDHISVVIDKTHWLNLSTPQLCYLHCIFENIEVIDEDGRIQMENFENFQKTLGLEPTEKGVLCLEEIEPIKTCQDILKPLECALNSV